MSEEITLGLKVMEAPSALNEFGGSTLLCTVRRNLGNKCIFISVTNLSPFSFLLNFWLA
jgi:hypothetical protein